MAAISSTFQSNAPGLGELLDQIHVGKLQLPDFQRPWVWDDFHIRSLLASVSLSYPIGAVMLLQTGGDQLRFKPRLVAGVPEETRSVQPERLILDGQQRLTSLYRALRSGRPVLTRNENGKEIERVYYLDIAGCLDPEVDREDAVIPIPGDRKVKSDFGRKVDLDLNKPENEWEKGYFPLDLLFDSTRYFEWRSGYLTKYRLDDERFHGLARFESEVLSRFQQFRVPVIELLKETPREAVCQVFEKVNTGGVSLTVFELLTATFAADNFNLRDDWEARQKRLRESPNNVLRAVEGTDFLQAVTLLSSYKRSLSDKTGVSCKRRDMLRLTLNDYQALADAIEEGFKKAARLLHNEKIFEAYNLPYRTQLIPLGATCAQIGDVFEQVSAREKLAQWYWCGVFGEVYHGATDARFSLDIQDLCAWVLQGAGPPRTISSASFSPPRLLSMQTRNSAAYKGLFAQMIKHGSRDFVSGDEISHSTGFFRPVDIHHIFPKAWCKKRKLKKNHWNSIVNKTPLTATTNRFLSSAAPSVYLGRVEKKAKISADKLDALLDTHILSPKLLRGDDFEAFLRDRASRLLDIIEEAMGKSVSGRSSEETVAEFGGPVGAVSGRARRPDTEAKPPIAPRPKPESAGTTPPGALMELLATDQEAAVARAIWGREGLARPAVDAECPLEPNPPFVWPDRKAAALVDDQASAFQIVDREGWRLLQIPTAQAIPASQECADWVADLLDRD